jgi:HEAT repeat protein
MFAMPYRPGTSVAVRRVHRLSVLFALAIALTNSSFSSQAQSPNAKPATDDPDGQVVGGAPAAPKTPAQLTDQAWTMLADAAGDVKHLDARSQALAALGLMGGTPRSLKLIEDAMLDSDVDVRTAAALAAGQTRAPAVTTPLRRLLDDKQPQVAYAAALALWKMGDKSGEDILIAVIDGERRASATLVNGTEHEISKDLHSPSTLAKIGVMQVGGMFLGPFGYGITAYEYIKKNGGESARASAIEALAEERTEPIKAVFLAALNDKDPSVRAAALKALGGYRQDQVTKAIAGLLDDSKVPVRLTAAAAYLISSGAAQASVNQAEPRPAPSARKHR